MSFPLIIHNNGIIFFYKKLFTEDEVVISNYLKKTTEQLQYTDDIEIYKIEDYCIVSILLMNSNSIDEFIGFLNKYTYNKIPEVILKRFREIEDSIKEVSLILGKAEIIIKVMKGDLSFLHNDKKFSKKLCPGKEKNSYVYPREDNCKLIEYLADKKVNMSFPSINTESNIDFKLKKAIYLRYYQMGAFEALINRKKGITVMPVGSGKTFVAMKLIEYLKRTTLILCEHRYNCLRWRELLIEYFAITEEDISICIDENCTNKVSKINIYSYDIIRTTADESIYQRLFNNKWGLIIYDNAHKVVTEKAVDLLYLKSTYKFAFDSTLSRSDGAEKSLLYLFGGLTYNITSFELVNNLFQKKLECYVADLRGLLITKAGFIKKLLNRLSERCILIVSYKNTDMEKINIATGIEFINSSTADIVRKQLIDDFKSRKLEKLCIGKLIESYSLTNVDVMIAAGYRGGTEIEDSFRIGTLVSTPTKLPKIVTTIMYYLIINDSEAKYVSRKELYLRNRNIILKHLDVSNYLGDENFESER